MAFFEWLAISKRFVKPVWPTSWHNPLKTTVKSLKGVKISLTFGVLESR